MHCVWSEMLKVQTEVQTLPPFATVFRLFPRLLLNALTLLRFPRILPP